VRLRVKFIGFPEIQGLLGRKEIQVESPGPTLGDLLRVLAARYGSPVRKALINNEGSVDSTVQVIRNEREWIDRDALDLPLLEEDDRVTFLMMMAGG